MRKSRQREEIKKVLMKKNYHPTAEEIYGEVRKSLPGVGIATIYRNLEQLRRSGSVVKIDLHHGAACYDGNVEKHYHIICQDCGRMQDVWIGEGLESHVDMKKAIPDYTVYGYRIDFTGICRDCEEKRKAEHSN